VTATKPVEADVVCGDPVNGYSFDWFTLYSQDSWSSSYFTPVPSTYNGATLYTTSIISTTPVPIRSLF